MFGRKSNDEAVSAHKDAKKALHDNQRREQAAGIDYETDEYRRLNRDVLDTEKDVSWFRR